jgi:hypothetical protein
MARLEVVPLLISFHRRKSVPLLIVCTSQESASSHCVDESRILLLVIVFTVKKCAAALCAATKTGTYAFISLSGVMGRSRTLVPVA